MKKKKKKHKSKNDNEVVAICDHPYHIAKGDTSITWGKAKKKCIKQFNNPCEFYIPIKK